MSCCERHDRVSMDFFELWESTTLAPSTPNFQVVGYPERKYPLPSFLLFLFAGHVVASGAGLGSTHDVFSVSLRVDAPVLALFVDDLHLHFTWLALDKKAYLLLAKFRWELRGFQEKRENYLQTDYAASTKPGFRMSCHLAASKSWDLSTLIVSSPSFNTWQCTLHRHCTPTWFFVFLFPVCPQTDTAQLQSDFCMRTLTWIEQVFFFSTIVFSENECCHDILHGCWHVTWIQTLIQKPISFKDNPMVWIVMSHVNCHQKQVIHHLLLQDWTNLRLVWMMHFDVYGAILTRHCAAVTWFPHKVIDAVTKCILCIRVPKLGIIGYKGPQHSRTAQKTLSLNHVIDNKWTLHLKKKNAGFHCWNSSHRKIVCDRNYQCICWWLLWNRWKRNGQCVLTWLWKEFQVGSQEWTM